MDKMFGRKKMDAGKLGRKNGKQVAGMDSRFGRDDDGDEHEDKETHHSDMHNKKMGSCLEKR